jgi:hypothetical protein
MAKGAAGKAQGAGQIGAKGAQANKGPQQQKGGPVQANKGPQGGKPNHGAALVGGRFNFNKKK